MIKVSVVVPTFQSKTAALSRLMRSLDVQTLPQNEFEVLFVDDGSGGETLARLDAIAAERRNVRVHSLPHSGWPSLARNTGIERSKGDYVLFMDHDDELYPDGLRSAYDFGRAHGADVVCAKETRTDKPGWALETFARDIPNAVGRTDMHPLQPMNPHKLYRRAFLNEHDIRFPVGEDGRVMWEDIVFNTRVARFATVISVLASVPFYHWVTVKNSSSTGFLRSDPEFWDALERVFTVIVGELKGAKHRRQREQMLLHQYSHRILSSFLRGWLRRDPAQREWIIERARELTERFVPQSLDAELDVRRRDLARLLRSGRRDELDELCAIDAGVAGSTLVERLEWVDGILTVETRERWQGGDGAGIALTRQGRRIVRDLPRPIAETLEGNALDVTAALGEARADLALRSRSDFTVWQAESRSVSDLSIDAGAMPSVSTVTRIDPASAALGAPLAEGSWDITGRVVFDGWGNHRAVTCEHPAAVALIEGTTAVAYRNKKGTLTLDIGQTKRSVINSSIPDIEHAETRLVGSVITFSIPLDGVAVHTRTVITGDVLMSRLASSARERNLRGMLTSVPMIGRHLRRGPGIHAARLVGDGTRAFLEGTLDVVPGEFRLAFRFSQRVMATRIRVSIDRDRMYRFSVHS